jgi:quercetin dioxygenase-like cupin family protein
VKFARLDDMVRGWFVGAFEPTALHTENCEVAVRAYRAGDREAAHYHRVATEVTLVLSGSVRMAGRVLSAGEIIVLDPGEVTDFEALTDSTNVVVKMPSAPNDKFPANAPPAP